MRIQLDREYILRGDADQVTLLHVSVTRSGANAGDSTEKPVGYYRDVTQALEAFALRKARQSDVSTIRGYINRLSEIRDDLRAAVEAAE